MNLMIMLGMFALGMFLTGLLIGRVTAKRLPYGAASASTPAVLHAAPIRAVIEYVMSQLAAPRRMVGAPPAVPPSPRSAAAITLPAETPVPRLVASFAVGPAVKNAADYALTLGAQQLRIGIHKLKRAPTLTRISPTQFVLHSPPGLFKLDSSRYHDWTAMIADMKTSVVHGPNKSKMLGLLPCRTGVLAVVTDKDIPSRDGAQVHLFPDPPRKTIQDPIVLSAGCFLDDGRAVSNVSLSPDETQLVVTVGGPDGETCSFSVAALTTESPPVPIDWMRDVD